LSNSQYLTPSHNIQQHLGAVDTKLVHQNTSKLGLLLGFFDIRLTVREIISFFLNFLRFQVFLILTFFQNVTSPYCLMLGGVFHIQRNKDIVYISFQSDQLSTRPSLIQIFACFVFRKSTYSFIEHQQK
jgi:hypothetical protein